MDVNSALWKRRLNGTIEAKEIPQSEWEHSESDKTVSRKLLCTWDPPYQLLTELPDWYELSLECMVDKDGNRKFSPVGASLANSPGASKGLQHVAKTEGLVLVASLGGHAILDDRGEIPEDLPFTSHEARVFNQYTRHLREYFGRTAKLGRVLQICAGGRPDHGTKHILSENLGLDQKEQEKPWDPIRLKEEGLRAAKAAGHENPTPDEILRFGLLTAAMQNPLPVKDEKTKGLVRLCLFDLGQEAEWVERKVWEEADRETRRKLVEKARNAACAYVAEQVKTSLGDHLADTTEEFDHWIEDPKANLIHRIQKRKGGPSDRQQVKEALLHLGWRTFEMLAHCFDAQMRAFRESLPEPLSESENAIFEHMFLASPAFGGIPLLLLVDRLEFLKEAILETWTHPGDKRAIAVVHTMMHYYSELASNRRDGDRRYKQRATHKTATGRVSRDESLLDDVPELQESSEHQVFKEAARRLATEAGFDCEFEDAEWGAKLIEEDTDDTQIAFCIYCPARKFVETLYVPHEEFVSAAEKVIEERKFKPGRQDDERPS